MLLSIARAYELQYFVFSKKSRKVLEIRPFIHSICTSDEGKTQLDK